MWNDNWLPGILSRKTDTHLGHVMYWTVDEVIKMRLVACINLLHHWCNGKKALWVADVS
jgi:hypothetical protein